MPGNPISPTIIFSTTNKSTNAYTATNLITDQTYFFQIRTHTPPHGEQKNDLWSESSEVVSARTQRTFVTVVDESQIPLEGVQVLLYRDNVRQEEKTSDDQGRVFFNDPRVGDTLVAMKLQHTEPSNKAAHDGWSYRIYTTNIKINDDGTVNTHEIKQSEEQILTVRKTNTLVLYNLVVSVEWDAYRLADERPNIPDATFFKELIPGLRAASGFLYDVTDGQFAFGKITIYDAGRHWDDADLQILVSNQVRPSATVGGITSTDTYTYTSSGRQQAVFYPGVMRMGRAWNRISGRDGRYDEPDAYRTLVHEFAHYALYLYDEYFALNEMGELIYDDAYCTSPNIRDGNVDLHGTQASLMDWHYVASELAMQGTSNWSPECKNTRQWQVHGESDWETVLGVYTDKETPARWNLITPTQRGGQPNPGPKPIDFTLFDFPHITITGTKVITFDKRLSLNVGDTDGTPVAQQNAQIFLFKQQADKTVRILEQGSPNSNGQVTLLGAEEDDVVKAISWDGRLFTSRPVRQIGSTSPLVLEPALWRPTVSIWPFLENTLDGQKGLDIKIDNVSAIDGSLLATLINLGGSVTKTVVLTQDATDTTSYSGQFRFELTEPIWEGHLWLQAMSTAGQTLETITNFAIGGAPGSHFRTYPPLDPASSDGNFRLYVPDGGVPDNTLAVVMPMRNAPSVPDDLTIVGVPYAVRATDNREPIDKPSSLTIFYNDRASGDISPEQLSVYHLDEEAKLWKKIGGDANPDRNLFTTTVERFGIYAVLALRNSPLPESPSSEKIYLPLLKR